MPLRLPRALSLSIIAAAAPAQTPLRHFPGDTPLGAQGWTVAAAGDVDGDGLPDVAVGDPYKTWPGPLGAVRVVSGADGSTLWETAGEAADDSFGWSLDRLDDVDGDGVADWVCGAFQNDAAGGSAGAVYLLSGASGAVLYVVRGDGSLEQLGYAVAGLDDVDGDGVADFAASAAGETPITPANQYGQVRVFSGALGTELARIDGTELFGGFGYSIRRIADVDGDGRRDLAVGAPVEDKGAPDSGAVHLFSSAGWAPLLTLAVPVASARFGHAVAAVGDLDGDGVGDLLVGAPTDASSGVDAGRAYALGSVTGTVIHALDGAASGDGFGIRVAGVKEVTGDGVSDLLVSSIFEDSTATDAGRVRVFSGATGALAWTMDGLGLNALFGSGLADLGDLNGDGWTDFAVGAYGETPPTGTFQAGAVWIWSGRDCPSDAYCTAKPNSLGCLPRISSLGVPLETGGADDFRVIADSVVNGKPGLLFWGYAPTALPFLGGWLCVSPPLRRTPVQSSGGTPPPADDCTGAYAYPFTQAWMAAEGFGAGDSVWCQYYTRDPGYPPPLDVGLTGGLEWTICP